MQEAFQAVGSVFSGKAQKAQANSEAALAERQAQDVDLQALQTSEARRTQLNSALSTIEARRAESGAGLDSPSGDAIASEMERQSARSESIGQVGFNNQKVSLLTSAAMKRQYGSTALTTGYLNGASYIAKGLTNAASTASLGG